MRINTISLGIKVRVKEYEMLDLMATFTPNDTMTLEEAMLDADQQLRDAAAAIVAKRNATAQAPAPAAKPQPQPETKQEEAKVETQQAEAKVETKAETQQEAEAKPAKEPLHFSTDTKKIQAIVKRIEKGVKLDKVLEYYEPDEDTLNVLKLAAKLN